MFLESNKSEDTHAWHNSRGPSALGGLCCALSGAGELWNTLMRFLIVCLAVWSLVLVQMLFIGALWRLYRYRYCFYQRFFVVVDALVQRCCSRLFMVIIISIITVNASASFAAGIKLSSSLFFVNYYFLLLAFLL